MPLIVPAKSNPVILRLAKDLTRIIKRGHPWVFADALRQQPKAPAGTPAILLDNKKGREIARGYYDANSPLAFRVCTTESGELLDDAWANRRLARALTLRQMLFNPDITSGYRLFNGEGDGLPGLICDIYDQTGVLQLDGSAPAGFWHVDGIARWLAQALSLGSVYLSNQTRQQKAGVSLIGHLPHEPVSFLENGTHYTADIIHGQKTGFFLDQRDNRQQVQRVAAKRRVLNVFGYTGGFSVAAGLGGASDVTTVDLAAPALELAEYHWHLNQLPDQRHHTTKADAFAFLERAAKDKQQWELVIVDPPSFASSQQTVNKAIAAYKSLIASAAAVTTPDGLLALASCSSHIDLTTFLNACENGISLAHRRATILNIAGPPADHPTPLPFSEFRYLKFVLMRVE